MHTLARIMGNTICGYHIAQVSAPTQRRVGGRYTINQAIKVIFHFWTELLQILCLLATAVLDKSLSTIGTRLL